jgi:hypothetical protein
MPRRFAIAARTQLGPQLLDLRRVDADGAPFVFAGGLRLGDGLALPLQHDLAFLRRHPCQNGQHELAGRVAGVQLLAAHGQDHQADAALRQVGFDDQQLGRAGRQPVRLGGRTSRAGIRRYSCLGWMVAG